MKRFGNWAVFLATVAAVAGVGISALAGPGAAPPALAAPALATAAPPLEVAQASQAGYIGTEACVVCHEGFDTTINATKHGLVRNERTPAAAQGCETCHGPGEAHSQDPENVKLRQFDHLSAKAVSDTCATCHNRGEHANWQGSQHSRWSQHAEERRETRADWRHAAQARPAAWRPATASGNTATSSNGNNGRHLGWQQGRGNRHGG